MAIGLVSFALLVMLGLMPVGLATMREAMEQTVVAEIVDKVSSDTKLLPFDKVDTYASGGPYYYDEYGMAQTNKTSVSRYKVTLEKKTTAYPGSTLTTSLSASVATLLVMVDRMKGNSPGSGTNATVRVVVIPNSGG